MINPAVIANATALQQQFRHAEPFRHLAIDDFFEPELCSQFLADFPDFEQRHAINEFGEVGNKAVIPAIATISPCYAALYEYINSREFLDRITTFTGIEDLLPDPSLFGGGTHENREGQNLDAHVDFNYSQDRQLHRRLNLLVYLNREWSEDWGGCIELHSDPRNPEHNVSKAYLPLFNRAVIFETNEHSWHGFKTIRLPADKKHLSRKCLSIYLYTRSRPEHEIVPEHSTFYIQDPLPDRFRTGFTLAQQDVAELKALLKDRDAFIHFYQQQELQKNGTIAEVSAQLDRVRQSLTVPAVGYARQQGAASGYWHDHWLEPDFSVVMAALRPVHGVIVKAYLPLSAPAPLDGVVSIGGHDVRHRFVPGENVLDIQLPAPLRETFRFAITTDSAQASANAIESGGQRVLAVLLTGIEFRHDGLAEAPGGGFIDRLKRRLRGKGSPEQVPLATGKA